MSITDEDIKNLQSEIENTPAHLCVELYADHIEIVEKLIAEHEASKGMQLVSSGVILCGEYHKDCNALISEIKRLKHEATKGMQWVSVDDESLKDYTGKMVLIFTPSCLVTQAYYSGLSFSEPWGDEYPGSKQPKLWMPLPPLPSGDEG